jgi:hypothetical protein
MIVGQIHLVGGLPSKPAAAWHDTGGADIYDSVDGPTLSRPRGHAFPTSPALADPPFRPALPVSGGIQQVAVSMWATKLGPSTSSPSSVSGTPTASLPTAPSLPTGYSSPDNCAMFVREKGDGWREVWGWQIGPTVIGGIIVWMGKISQWRSTAVT